MSRMRQTHTSTNTINHQDHESNLDALLEDLQTTVSRSNSQLNLNGGTVTTGYREVRRTVTDGTPHGTMNEYQIEYLNPANSTHHLVESTHHNGQQNQRNPSSYKEYQYSTSERSVRSDAKLKQNISELDSLLDDLNTAQKKNFSENTTISRNISGIDAGLLEPVQSSTPHNRVVEQKHYREERVNRGRSSSPRRELVFTGPRSRDPSPIGRDQQWDQGPPGVRQQQFYRYEKTTSTRTTGPNYVQEMNTSFEPNQTLRSNLAIEDSSLRGRSPSPGGNRIEYHYSNNMTNIRDNTPLYSNEKVTTYRDNRDQETTREYSPQRYTTGKTTNSYSYSSTSKDVKSSEVPRSPPPPHRSPSPVTFQQPPLPAAPKRGVPYSYENQPPQSPQPPQKFSPSDPSNRLTYTVSQQPQTTVSTYKYSSTTTNNYTAGSQGGYPGEEAPLLPRPFPTPSPTPEQQQPPKKLDDLMATFSDGQRAELRNRHNTTNTTLHRYDSDRSNQALIPNGGYEREREKEKIIEKDKTVIKKEESKNVEGPPVYYPPGVELFSKKEEAMSQQQSGGGMYKAKAKYEYEAMSKSKHKESSGKAVVPVCLPVCCAMPCTIM